jgi:hypothetical protein
MKTITAVSLTILASSFVVACGGAPPPAPKPPEPAPVEAVAPPAPSSAPSVEAPPPASASATPPAAPPPAGPSIKETVGAVSKVELMAGGKKKLEITKAAEVEALLKAIGTEQIPSGPKRRCMDDWTVVMKDAAGAEKGSVGLCKVETLGPEFFAPSGERKGITLADEAALKKALHLDEKPAGKPPSGAPAKPAAPAAPKK